MQCRRCDALSRVGASPRRPARTASVWGADRISGLRCARCGALLVAEDIARLLLEKQSQLAQFGLLTPPRAAPSPPAPPAMRLEDD